MNKPIYQLGQTVYHVSDEMQKPFIVTGIINRPGNVFTYFLSDENGEKEAYDIELSSEKIIF